MSVANDAFYDLRGEPRHAEMAAQFSCVCSQPPMVSAAHDALTHAREPVGACDNIVVEDHSDLS